MSKFKFDVGDWVTVYREVGQPFEKAFNGVVTSRHKPWFKEPTYLIQKKSGSYTGALESDITYVTNYRSMWIMLKEAINDLRCEGGLEPHVVTAEAATSFLDVMDFIESGVATGSVLEEEQC